MLPAVPKFVIADTHWGHGNVVKYCNRPPNHDWIMLERWAETVGPRDVVAHLGDLIWNRAGHLWPDIKRLPGVKYLVEGNHDTFTAEKFRREMGFELVRGDWQLSYHVVRCRGVRVALSHAPLKWLPGLSEASWDLNVHGHVHNHGRTDARHACVCVELTDYRPVELEQVVFDWELQRRLGAQ